MSDYKIIKENLHGCSNHSCVIKPPVGMGTNGPCHCLDDRQKLQRFVYVRNEEIKDLQQQLLLSQKREMDLRETLESCKYQEPNSMAMAGAEYYFDTVKVKQALSTPPTLDDLYKWRDAEIEKVLGEPVAYKFEYKDSETKKHNICAMVIDDPECQSLLRRDNLSHLDKTKLYALRKTE